MDSNPLGFESCATLQLRSEAACYESFLHLAPNTPSIISRCSLLKARLHSIRQSFCPAIRQFVRQQSTILNSSTKLGDARSFCHSENAPWHHTLMSSRPQRADFKQRGFCGAGDKSPPQLVTRNAETESSHKPLGSLHSSMFSAPSCSKKNTGSRFDLHNGWSGLHVGGAVASPTITAKSEARQKLCDILAKHGRSSSASGSSFGHSQSRLGHSKSLPTHILEPASRATVPTLVANTSAAGTVSAHVAGETSLGTKPPPLRRSRFLRPDFYDTPRENSKYVIQNEVVRAFRERSLSRHRDLCHSRSRESFVGVSATECVAASVTSDSGSSGCGKLGRRAPSVGRHGDSAPSAEARLDDTPVRQTDLAAGCASQHRRLAAGSCENTLLLQSELENEIRKTKSMHSKLNGLMVALDDAETQYAVRGRNQRRAIAAVKVDDKPEYTPSDSQQRADGCGGPWPSIVEGKLPNGNGDAEMKSKQLSSSQLVEKKFGYPRVMRSDSLLENGAAVVGVNDKMQEVLFENGTSTLSVTGPPDETDSDGCSLTLADAAESRICDELSDRIRRRSFYSRFNIYKQKSRSDAAQPVKGPLSLLPYSRSLSADYRRRPADVFAPK